MKKFNWGVIVVPAVCIAMFLLGAAVVWVNVIPAQAEPLEYTVDPRTGKTWHKWCRDNGRQRFWIPMVEWDGVGTPPSWE